ncbi:MAG: ORF6N domain-containing protein [Prevotella sp.]|nr:ORF6N domain-containing protein [Prevotella sp.]
MTKDETAFAVSGSQIATLEMPINKESLEAITSLRSQFATSNKRGGSRYLPYAFTELGVAMLSSVLNSETAININRDIMRAFVAFRRLATQPLPDSNAELRKEIQTIRDEMEEILADQNDINEMTSAQLDAISMALAELQSDKNKLLQKPRRPIGFNV